MFTFDCAKVIKFFNTFNIKVKNIRKTLLLCNIHHLLPQRQLDHGNRFAGEVMAFEMIFFVTLTILCINIVILRSEKYYPMCTVSVNIDDAAVRRINPLLTSRESISLWLQRQVDELIEDMAVQSCSLSPNAHTAEEMKAIVVDRIKLMESGEATYIDGEEGFAQIRKRYGL